MINAWMLLPAFMIGAWAGIMALLLMQGAATVSRSAESPDTP